MILDYYFRRPVLWDFIISLVISIVSFLLLKRDIFVLPKVEESYGKWSTFLTVCKYSFFN